MPTARATMSFTIAALYLFTPWKWEALILRDRRFYPRLRLAAQMSVLQAVRENHGANGLGEKGQCRLKDVRRQDCLVAGP